MQTTSPRGFTREQLIDVWTRHRAGESRHAIARAVGKRPGSVHFIIRSAGGIAPRLRARAPRVLSLAERQHIARALPLDRSFREIARTLDRAPSTISREVGAHGGRAGYDAEAADRAAAAAARRPKRGRLAQQPELAAFVTWALEHRWSPPQIAGWLRALVPFRPELYVSPETIYRTLFIQARGVLKKELQRCLRRPRVARRARTATRKRQGRGQIVAAVPISARPPEAADRAVPGHWEGDLLAGAWNSHIITLVERTSRFTILIKVTSKETAVVIDALIRQILRLPQHLARSLTWDRGSELAHHHAFTVATGVQVYFCDPQSPWQRGTNENTNGLLRQYFPKGMSLATVTQDELDAVADELNGRPRQTLGFATPTQVYNKAVASIT
jgi:IS30 family transposase